MVVQTIKNLFSKPVTVKYPQEPSPPPPNYRGLIVYKEELCIFCTKCELVCPPGAIRFTYSEDGSKKFHYNPYLCIYCGECVRACPKEGCLTQVEETAPPATESTIPDWNGVEREAVESKKAWLAARQKRAKKS
ncbi:4Fe-4S dicluster domain-containing protein [Thermovibrio ammonificans]